jgi:hypothetical protein
LPDARPDKDVQATIFIHHLSEEARLAARRCPIFPEQARLPVFLILTGIPILSWYNLKDALRSYQAIVGG